MCAVLDLPVDKLSPFRGRSFRMCANNVYCFENKTLHAINQFKEKINLQVISLEQNLITAEFRLVIMSLRTWPLLASEVDTR